MTTKENKSIQSAIQLPSVILLKRYFIRSMGKLPLVITRFTNPKNTGRNQSALGVQMANSSP